MFEIKTDESVLVTKIEFASGPMQHTALILQPKQPSREEVPGILWIHGGGYMTGMKEMVLFSRAAELVKRYGVVVMAPDYRLSVQAPYPAAINDCYDALVYLKEHSAMLGVREDQIMVGGESAGGGLTAALCMMARDKGEINICYQMPLYPMLDNYDTESSRDNHGKNWDTRRNHIGWRLYLRENARQDVSPYAAAARETDYTDLPPAYTFVGDGEPFYTETLTYIDNLKRAGVEEAVDVYPSDFHAFDLMKPELEISKEAAAKFNEHFEYALQHYFAPQPKREANPRIKVLDAAIALRHELHKHAELSMQETETKRILMDFITKNTTLKVVDKGSWFYAEYRCGSDKAETIAFRAEMDALPMKGCSGLAYGSINPGVSHQCGHDGHAATLCALGLVLSRQGAARNIILIIQPGEEIGAGAEECAPLIREKKIKEIYAYHNWSGFPLNTVVTRKELIHCPSMGITYTFKGSQAHASQPEDGKNPAGAVSEFVLEFDKAMGERDALSFATIVGVSVGTGDFGIAPGEGSVSLTLRAASEKTMETMHQGLCHLAEELAAREGLTMEESTSDVFPETVNDAALVEKILDTAERLGLTSVELEDPIRSSEDFGYFQKECPGAIFYVGNGEEYPQIHTEEFDFNDDIMATALNLFMVLGQVGEEVDNE